MFTRRVPIGARRLFSHPSTLPPKRYTAQRPPSAFTQPRRTFHASRPHRISLSLDTLLEPGHALLTLLHATGLPWMAVIPLSALAIRAALLPITDIPNTRAALFLQSTFTPLRRARAAAMYAQLRTQALRVIEPGAKPDGSDVRVRIRGELVADGKRVARRWGVPAFWRGALRGFVQFPVFWGMVEAIRRMAGAPRGLLGWVVETLGPVATKVVYGFESFRCRNLMTGYMVELWDGREEELKMMGLDKREALAERRAEWAHYQASLESEKAVDTLDPVAQGAVQQEMDGLPTVAQGSVLQTPDVVESGVPESALQESVVQGSIGPVPATDIAQAAIEHHAWYDPSFAEGGMLWFTDLAALDQSMILPTMVCGMMFWTIGSSQAGLTGGGLLMKRILQLVPVGLWFLLINIPSGVLYYWFCSQVCKRGAQKLVERIYKEGSVMAIDRTPCRAPVRRVFVKGQGRFYK